MDPLLANGMGNGFRCGGLARAGYFLGSEARYIVVDTLTGEPEMLAQTSLGL